jgi:PIN domain nuclease of toxin-antitoxin system
MLLDTCALLWLASGGGELTDSALERIDLSPTVWISAITGFEISLKYKKENSAFL